MTILRHGVDAGLGTRAIARPNEGDGILFAHLLLLPVFERSLPGPAGIQAYRARLCRDIDGYREPAAAVAAAGSLRRSTAHLLAMHAVHCFSRPLRETRPLHGTRAFRGLQLHCLRALDRSHRGDGGGGRGGDISFGGGDDES